MGISAVQQREGPEPEIRSSSLKMEECVCVCSGVTCGGALREFLANPGIVCANFSTEIFGHASARKNNLGI